MQGAYSSRVPEIALALHDSLQAVRPTKDRQGGGLRERHVCGGGGGAHRSALLAVFSKKSAFQNPITESVILPTTSCGSSRPTSGLLLTHVLCHGRASRAHGHDRCDPRAASDEGRR